MGPVRKKKKTIAKIDDFDILGIFPICVSSKIIPYYVCVANRETITKNFIKFLLGNNVEFESKSLQVAIDTLFERDHGYFLLLLNGEIEVGRFGPKFVPLVFFTKVPEVLIPEAFEKRLQNTRQASSSSSSYQLSETARNLKWKINDGKAEPKDHINHGTLRGDMAERKVFEALQKYFDLTKDDCLVLHSYSFLHRENYREKDFVILNLTKGYVMDIEVKVSENHFESAKDQLMDSKVRIQAIFDSIENMSSQWKFIGVCYIENGLLNKDFVINGSDDISERLARIEGKINHFTPWNPNEHVDEFVKVSKHLLFEAQGHPKAPISEDQQVVKISKEFDQASTPENIMFWTPEQLSIVHAMDVDFMVLMGYYGTGKTVLLLERAEYLSRNPDNMVHFFVDKWDGGVYKGNPGLEEHLNFKFAGRTNVRVQSGVRIFRDGLSLSTFNVKSDHCIIDEAIFNQDEDIAKLENLKSQFASLWIAIGDFHLNVQEFKKKAEDNGFTCPILQHCLRNGSNIVDASKSTKTPSEYFSANLTKFRENVEVKSKINRGIFKRIQAIYQNDIEAAKQALLNTSQNKKYFIVVQSDSFSISDLKTANQEHDFESFDDIQARQIWVASEKDKNHLVLQAKQYSSNVIGGLEFDQMIYICPTCLKCGTEHSIANIITRAKALLIMSSYGVETCVDCPKKSYEDMTWNVVDYRWDLKQGIQLSQIGEESRKVYEATTEVRNRLEPSNIINPLQSYNLSPIFS